MTSRALSGQKVRVEADIISLSSALVVRVEMLSQPKTAAVVVVINVPRFITTG